MAKLSIVADVARTRTAWRHVPRAFVPAAGLGDGGGADGSPASIPLEGTEQRVLPVEHGSMRREA
jgi:hypothetical protein